MHTIQLQLSEVAFSKAEIVASTSGFSSADAYITDLVEKSLKDSSQQFFTPEIIAEIDAAAAEARTSNNLSLDQSKADIARVREEWRASQSS